MLLEILRIPRRNLLHRGDWREPRECALREKRGLLHGLLRKRRPLWLHSQRWRRVRRRFRLLQQSLRSRGVRLAQCYPVDPAPIPGRREADSDRGTPIRMMAVGRLVEKKGYVHLRRLQKAALTCSPALVRRFRLS
jgi:hypothetical protein